MCIRDSVWTSIHLRLQPEEKKFPSIFYHWVHTGLSLLGQHVLSESHQLMVYYWSVSLRARDPVKGPVR